MDSILRFGNRIYTITMRGSANYSKTEPTRQKSIIGGQSNVMQKLYVDIVVVLGAQTVSR